MNAPYLDWSPSQRQPRTSSLRVQAVQTNGQKEPRASGWLQADLLPRSRDRICRCMVSERGVPHSSCLSFVIPASDICHGTMANHISFTRYRDTVASVGLLMARNLPFTTANTTIKTFRHALSLDEVSEFSFT